MRVVLERQTEMTDVAGLVDSLRHRADHGRRDEPGIGPVADLLQQVAQVLGRDLVGRRQPDAEFAHERAQRLEPVDLRQAVHAIQRRHAIAIEEPRGGHVGRDHAFLDQPMRVVAQLLDDAPRCGLARRT